jgi:hypothetical protein
LPQACNQPASIDLPEGRDHRSPCSDAVGLEHDSVDRDVFLIPTLGTYRCDAECLDDAVGSRIETDGGVLADHGAIERRCGYEKPEKRLLFRRRTAGE